MGIKLVTRLRLGLSHLTEHKFKHSFQDTLNHLCNCKIDVESFTHLLLKCHSYINERWPSWATWKELTHKYFKHLCNFWQTHFFLGIRLTVTNATIGYIRSTKMFDEPLFWITLFLSFLIFNFDKFTSFYGYKFQHNFF